MIGRRGLLGLLGALPFVGSALANTTPSDPTIWIRKAGPLRHAGSRRIHTPIPWERHRFETFEEHVRHYMQNWGGDIEYGVSDSRTVEPTQWLPGGPPHVDLKPSVTMYSGVTDPDTRNARAKVGDLYINSSNCEVYSKTEDGWQFVGNI